MNQKAIKIVGFKVGRDHSTCYYKIPYSVYDEPFSIDEVMKKRIGQKMASALDKSDFVSVRK